MLTKTTEENTASRRELWGSAAAGGIVGLAVGGPLFGVVSGGVAAIVATTKSKAGEVTRSCGEVTATVGDHLVEFNRDHHLVQKTKDAAGSLVQSAKKLDEKHHVVEKTSNSIVSGANYVSKKLSPTTTNDVDSKNHDESVMA